MTSQLDDNRQFLFHIKPLITNFRCKLSTTTSYDPNKQILCLVSEDNEILLRYTNNQDVNLYKVISWFKQKERVIHDVCFDPSGAWLLVLCFDNTLHIVPALKLLDPTQSVNNTAFSITEITSFVIPFVGPHECPNSKTCPNNGASNTTSSSPLRLIDIDPLNQRESNTNELQQQTIGGLNQIAVPLINENSLDTVAHIPYSILESETFTNSTSTDTTSTSRKSSKRLLKDSENQTASSSNESGGGGASESFRSSYTCPYPLCVIWWQTIDKRNRAIIGYSDGSICFVGLTPNCPFIGNTSIENGAISKLIICHDNNDENVTLLINSTNKEQWKLLLEQKSIKYIFPADLSPTTSQNSDNSRSGVEDWTFVMPIQQISSTNTNNNLSANSSLPSVVGVTEKTTSDLLKNDEIVKSSSSEISINQNQIILETINNENISVSKGILPAARARLSLLKNLGTKKLNAFKMRLSDAKSKLDGYISEESLNSFTMIDSPTTVPEILTTSPGPYYHAQNLRNTLLLSALHSYSDILSIHRMDLKLIPLFHYKIPKNCLEIMISSNLLYSIQLVKQKNDNKEQNVLRNIEMDNDDAETTTTRINKVDDNDDENDIDDDKLINAVGVISSAMASIKNGDISKFNERALFGLFTFPNENIINIHRMAVYDKRENINQQSVTAITSTNTVGDNKDETIIKMNEIKTPISYVRLHKNLRTEEEFTKLDVENMKKEFPKINYDPCIVVTNKNTYFIDLNKEPHTYFLNAAFNKKWKICEEFCTTFDLSYSQCIEFAGDCFLRKKKVAKALCIYNVGHIPPVRTALKLAMFGENYALMHLCATALKSVYILKSNFINNPFIKYLIIDCNRRYCNDIESIIPKLNRKSDEIINAGKLCSNYIYDPNEQIGTLQMSVSSQFHLSNLLLITLTEHAVKQKNYNLAVWNFITINSKFHTNMTSIVLCQSGLYMAALLLAMIRGCSIDIFVGFVSVSHQEFGWYSEINVLFYNLSEMLFCECITYLRHVSADYFNVIQNKLQKFDETVLQRLEAQLNPFLPVFRPIISHRYIISTTIDENDSELIEFSKLLIETYLSIIMQIDAIKMKPSNILNALNSHRITYEDNQFAIKTSNFPPIAVGYSHSACVIDGYAYFWGSSGIPLIYSVGKPIDPPEPPHVIKYLEILSQLNLEVHAVKCGRQHSLILTNNGLYAFGLNNLGQLGINKKMQASLQPMLVESLDCKDITILEAGQYHNAVVADGKLYTWGWGAYGQLGHGDVENVPEPKLVRFFIGKKVAQISLGHSHSLVLCKQQNGNTELYVFGSNHFGQLGVTQQQQQKSSSSPYPIKCLVPIKIEVSKTNIRLIHTKFFCSFAVDDNNYLYTWGLSPQALRLTNQVKRRANAKQKIEETLKKEMYKRSENGLDNKDNNNFMDIIIPEPPRLSGGHSKSSNVKNLKRSLSSGRLIDGLKKEKELEEGRNEGLSNFRRRRSDSSSSTNISTGLEPNKLKSFMKPIESEKILPPKTIEKNLAELEVLISNEKDKTNSESQKSEETVKAEETDKKAQNTLETDSYEYMIPQKVDTSEVSGQILQMSSGLLHFALISSTSMLFTWGKNLEHQLGTEDKDRKAVNKPTPLESIENPLHVECGADFTIVITRDYVVKAFGGNANGQCGRDTSPPSDKKPAKLFCLPTTKRLMRFEGNCVESPIDVNLPRPQIRMDSEPTRYLKSIPKFRQSFVIKPNISFGIDSSKSAPSGISGLTDDDCGASSIENISFLDEDSLCSALNGLRNLSSNDISPDDDERFTNFNNFDNINNNSLTNSNDTTDLTEFRNYIHYCLYIFHGLYDTEKIIKISNNNIEYRIRMLMLNYKYINAYLECLNECHNAQKTLKIFEFFTKDPSIVPMKRKDLKYFIYHLFIHFISKNFDILDCENFFLCNLDYYLLDLSYIMYFNNNNTDLEHKLNQKFKIFFMNDLDDNDNNVLQQQQQQQQQQQSESQQQQQQQKQKNDQNEFKLDNTDIIFETLSIKFKAIVCQRLLQTYKI